MGRHLPREFASSAVSQILRNLCGPERVIAGQSLDPRIHRALPDNPVDIRFADGESGWFG
jgi:hypothetical protein